jgi:acetyl esterase/lipase
MSTRHLVHPDLSPLLEIGLSLDTSEANVENLRAQTAAQLPPPGTFERDDVECTEHFCAGLNDAPDVRFLVYRPKNSSGPLPLFLHIHGGGHILGKPEVADMQSYAFAADMPCLVASVDYRKAPEARAPGSVEDCYAVLEHLHGNAGAWGIDTDRIAIGGESAGAHIAAALALMVRDRGEIPVMWQHLIYPMLDDRTVTKGHSNTLVGEFVWTRQNNIDAWKLLLDKTPGGPDVGPYEAPARATDLSDLPPAYIWVGALDLFLEECMEYAQRLLAAGVPTELHVAAGFFHGAETLLPDAPACRRVLQERFDVLKNVFYKRAET